MNFIDTHAHLYLKEFEEDRETLMQKALEAGVSKTFLPNIDSSTISSMLALEKNFPGQAYAMMGLHPCSVNESVEVELQKVEHWLSRRHFAAIGEIGLDFYWDVTFKEQQLHAFSLQIDYALRYDLPIVIHSRNSTRECIDLVRSKQNGKLKGVFHCFSGTQEEANEIIELGFYMGIGGVVTFKKSSLPDILQKISLEHLVLETDAPYLAPVPYRGKRNESSYIPLIAEKIAGIKDVPLEEVAKVTTSNAGRLYSF